MVEADFTSIWRFWLNPCKQLKWLAFQWQHTRLCGLQFLDDQKEMHSLSTCQQPRTDKSAFIGSTKSMAVTVLHELTKCKQEKNNKRLDLHCLQPLQHALQFETLAMKTRLYVRQQAFLVA